MDVVNVAQLHVVVVEMLKHDIIMRFLCEVGIIHVRLQSKRRLRYRVEEIAIKRKDQTVIIFVDNIYWI